MWEWKCINYKLPCELAIEQRVLSFPGVQNDAQCPTCRHALVKTAQYIQSRGWWSRTLRPVFWGMVLLLAGGAYWWFARSAAAPTIWKLEAPGAVTVSEGDEVSEIFAVSPVVPVKFTTDKPLPEGITLEENGRLHGRPMQSAEAEITITATDESKRTQNAVFHLTVQINQDKVNAASTNVEIAAQDLHLLRVDEGRLLANDAKIAEINASLKAEPASTPELENIHATLQAAEKRKQEVQLRIHQDAEVIVEKRLLFQGLSADILQAAFAQELTTHSAVFDKADVGMLKNKWNSLDTADKWIEVAKANYIPYHKP